MSQDETPMEAGQDNVFDPDLLQQAVCISGVVPPLPMEEGGVTIGEINAFLDNELENVPSNAELAGSMEHSEEDGEELATFEGTVDVEMGVLNTCHGLFRNLDAKLLEGKGQPIGQKLRNRLVKIIDTAGLSAEIPSLWTQNYKTFACAVVKYPMFLALADQALFHPDPAMDWGEGESDLHNMEWGGGLSRGPNGS